jgi:propionyl-CoA synthetase
MTLAFMEAPLYSASPENFIMSITVETRRRSLEDPEGFWGEVAEGIDWITRWDRVLDDSNPPYYRWFPGAQLNTCYNALDRHVEKRGNQAALIYASNGVAKGDRVLLYMPMIPEAVIAMLACARLGAVHSVVFGGFAPQELATRIDDAEPKAIVSASCGIEGVRVIEYKPLLDQAIDLSKHKPASCIIRQRESCECELTEGRDVSWQDAVAAAKPHDCVPVMATDPLYILYTSGTTGVPKGVVRDNGGHAVALRWTMQKVYDIQPGDVYWAASDVGWVVGHSYIVYGPLLNGNTTILYEGKPVGTPDAGAFWRVIADHGVNCMFTAPTAFRAIKKEDPTGALIANYDMSTLRSLFLAGERSDPDTLVWAEEKLGVPVIDHWWQTETGWAICANCLGIEHLPVKHGSPSLAIPGWDVQVVDESCRQVPAGTTGALVVKLPLPPGSLPTLWHDDERFVSSYLTEFPGYYKTADAGYIDEDGDVAECAVIGVADELKGEIPLGFLVLNAGVDRPYHDIVSEVIQMIRAEIGPVAAFRTAIVVERLPKTRSGKILRGTMKKIADRTEWKMPATIDDPVILDEITGRLQAIGYG